MDEKEVVVVESSTASPLETMKEERLLTSSERKKNERMMKVMVAIDDSRGSFYALEWTLDHLFYYRSVGGSGGVDLTPSPLVGPESDSIYIVHVLQPLHRYASPAEPVVYSTGCAEEAVKKAQEEAAAAILSRASELCKKMMVKVETVILEGEPREKICEAVEIMNVDLLVVGSRGLGKIRRAFLGSVSDHCAHHAKSPILIVKPPKEKTIIGAARRL